MKPSLPVLIAFASLSACHRQAAAPAQPKPLSTDTQIVQATLRLLASDGQPVCVERETFGSPLSIYRVARRGDLQNVYDLGWYPPKPFRPPLMPTLKQLNRSAKLDKNAEMPEPMARTDALPAKQQADLDIAAHALAPPKVTAHRVGIAGKWVPAGVFPRLWPAGQSKHGCQVQYVLSAVKYNAHAAFVAVRVDHWGTVYALAPSPSGWQPIAQWSSWLY